MKNLEQKLPVTYLLFTFRGRIGRIHFITAFIFILSTYYVLLSLLNPVLGKGAAFVVYPILLWTTAAIITKRLHDNNKSGKWALVLFVPIVGIIYLLFLLFIKGGQLTENKYGLPKGMVADYYQNNNGEKIDHLTTGQTIINDVTGLNPVIVEEVFRPSSISELQEKIKANKNKAFSVGGGRFSMGGQTASPGTLHIDMRGLNKIIEFKPEQKTIIVETGIRWCDIQKHIDPYGLSVKIMQTYANFTVGGSLSVNVHGRYIGYGPLILSVQYLDLLTADGQIQRAERNSTLFNAAIGGYNAVGIITQVGLELEENTPVQQIQKKLNKSEYAAFFKDQIRENKEVIFHNGDIFPPAYNTMRAVSWVTTTEKPTTKTRLMPLKDSYPLERYFIWAFTETPFGKWRRENLIEPILYLFKRIYYRNYEAGYDVAELEPESRKESTYVLQEYFVPIEHFDGFTDKMREIFIRHDVNVVNVSCRHAFADSGSILAWAKEEVFAFVIYYKQLTGDEEKNKVAVWTRELIDAALSENGRYYLPYQAHATDEQFHKAYPRAKELFELKKKYDPQYQFRNVLWDKYYAPRLKN